MAERVTRNYGGSDAAMLRDSKVFRTMFVSDKDLFTAIDPDFVDPFADNWQRAITEAEDIAEDVMLIDELAARTENLKEVFENCRQHYHKMQYYINKAFADSSAILNAFGYSDFKKVKSSETRMVRVLKLLYVAALNHSAELTSAGCPAEDIESIENLRRDLEDAYSERETFKKERNTITEERVNKLNLCRIYTLKVSRASKIVFAGQPAKLKTYKVSTTAAHHEPLTEPVLFI